MALVLALFGSPREKSITSYLHERFLEGFEPGHAVRRFRLHDLNVRPCSACGHCRDGYSCVFDDDMTPMYDLILQARLVSLSAPVYFSGLPGPVKTVIDRCQVLWELSRRDCLNGPRTGFFISAGEGRYPNQFQPSVITVRHFFNSIGCDHREEDYLLVPGAAWAAADIPADIVERAREAGTRVRALIEATP